MIETITDFPFLGGRDYIHGTSILSGFVAALEAAAPGRITVKRLKFQRPSRTNGRLVVTRAALDEAESAGANCTLSAAVDDTVWRGFFVEEDRPVAKRLPVSYAISDLHAERYGGHCVISPANRDDLVRVLVEANKRFHEAAFPGHPAPTVRFGYIEDWSVPPASISFARGRLDARNVIAKKGPDGVMTINRLTYTGGSAESHLTLCFDVQRTVQ